MAVTIKDIARLANVSITTVSKIMNGKDADISEKTRNRVNRIIQENRYSPNSLARSLITNKTNTIGLVLPDISNAFFSDISRGVQNCAWERKYSVIFCDTNDSIEQEAEYIRVLRHKRVEGIVFLSTQFSNHDEVIKVAKSGLPVVILDRRINDGNVDIVSLDQEQGGYLATKHLLDQGHVRIGMMTGRLGNASTISRLNGYKRALTEAGIEYNPEWVFEGNYRITGGQAGAADLHKKGVTAIFAGNDMQAVGAYKYLFSIGCSIPADISIIGFDDIYIADIMTPGLTTIRQPTYDMGYKAAEILIEAISNTENTGRGNNVIFQPELVIRGSVAQPRGL